MKHSVVYILFLLFAIQSIAQDIHFSNFYTNALNVNPALTGYFKGKYRCNISYRDQYRTVAVPYQTISVGFDAKIKNRFGFKKNVGYGVLLNYDVAGDAQFKTIQISIPLSKLFTSYNKKWYHSIGIMPGVFFNSMEYTYLRFPEQFDGVQYNPDIIPTEEMQLPSRGFFNLSSGIQSTFKYSKTQSYSLGLAGFNLTKPHMAQGVAGPPPNALRMPPSPMQPVPMAYRPDVRFVEPTTK